MGPQDTAHPFILHVNSNSGPQTQNLLLISWMLIHLNFSYESVQLVERIDSEHTKDQIMVSAWSPDKKYVSIIIKICLTSDIVCMGMYMHWYGIP